MSNEAPSARRRRRSELPTLREVARAAGVSAITASRALNHPERVNERTRARVLDAVEQLGYVPNLVAGSLASARSRFIAVIVPSLANAVFIEVIQGLQETFESQGYQILLGNTDYDTEREYQLVRTFLGWSCSALVTAGLRHHDACRTLLANWDKPIVEVMELGEAIDLNVGLDHTEAGRCMARHLLERGHRRILFVAARMGSDYRAGMRYGGHREVIERAGFEAPVLELDRFGSLDAGAAGLEQALADHPGVSAIHFANDDLATGALLHAQRLGLHVPQDLAIAGFNGLPLGQHVTPRLTTIRSPRQQMGQLAASEVIRRLEGQRPQALQHDVGFELLVGEST
ncbi:LacI family DNA-binding transcriptional regulator [Billgrantia sp. LNSP4103-1]|uniref:LacI family DNA-binding transcriptional regulator n=1 Tax=Billgrantia sp. LNSP4103-1 TaxID=3410266 RepID=UPI00403FA773